MIIKIINIMMIMIMIIIMLYYYYSTTLDILNLDLILTLFSRVLLIFKNQNHSLLSPTSMTSMTLSSAFGLNTKAQTKNIDLLHVVL